MRDFKRNTDIYKSYYHDADTDRYVAFTVTGSDGYRETGRYRTRIAAIRSHISFNSLTPILTSDVSREEKQ